MGVTSKGVCGSAVSQWHAGGGGGGGGEACVNKGAINKLWK